MNSDLVPKNGREPYQNGGGETASEPSVGRPVIADVILRPWHLLAVLGFGGLTHCFSRHGNVGCIIGIYRGVYLCLARDVTEWKMYMERFSR